MSAISVVILTLMLWGRQTSAEEDVAEEKSGRGLSMSQSCFCNDTIFRFSEKPLNGDKDIRLSTFRYKDRHEEKQKVQTCFLTWIYDKNLMFFKFLTIQVLLVVNVATY
jgi:hypothetical protein